MTVYINVHIQEKAPRKMTRSKDDRPFGTLREPALLSVARIKRLAPFSAVLRPILGPAVLANSRRGAGALRKPPEDGLKKGILGFHHILEGFLSAHSLRAGPLQPCCHAMQDRKTKDSLPFSPWFSSGATWIWSPQRTSLGFHVERSARFRWARA